MVYDIIKNRLYFPELHCAEKGGYAIQVLSIFVDIDCVDGHFDLFDQLCMETALLKECSVLFTCAYFCRRLGNISGFGNIRRRFVDEAYLGKHNVYSLNLDACRLFLSGH